MQYSSLPQIGLDIRMPSRTGVGWQEYGRAPDLAHRHLGSRRTRVPSFRLVCRRPGDVAVLTIAASVVRSSALVFDRQRPIGRPFEPIAEAELIPGLIATAIRRAFRGSRTVVVPELRGPYGVVDLAVLETTDELLAARSALGIPPVLNQLDAAIIGVLNAKRATTLYMVACRLGWVERHIAEHVDTLVRRGTITRMRSGALVRPAGLEPLGRMSVYEAKVRDWRRGLDQASTYATWADRATLAVGQLPRDVSQILDAAEKLRLGLIAEGKWRLAPTPQVLSRQTRFWASEHLYAALL